MKFVIGARGRLGEALIAHLPAEDTVALPRSIYAAWTEPDAASTVTRYFEPWNSGHHVIFVAAGVIDPKRPAEEHRQVNLMLPQNIIKGVARSGIRVVTFGTIMEEIVGPASGNPYFESKLGLSEYVRSVSESGINALHVRIHTLYGGRPPDKFMFLGQLLDAVRRKDIFQMSAGAQLREYHHVDDDAEAIAVLAKAPTTGAINLSHGAPVRLRDLATYICDRFGCLDRLQIGALTSPCNDNYGQLFESSPILAGVRFRETFGSVFDYLNSHFSEA